MKKRYKAGIFVAIFLLVLQIGALPMTLPEAARLQKDVLLAPYSIWDYEIHEFDCSNMAAFLNDYLRAKGWNTSIAGGSHPGRTYGHAWVEIDGKPIDAKTKLVLLGAKPFFDYRYPNQNQEQYRSADEVIKSFQNQTWAEKEYGYTQYVAQKKIESENAFL